MWIRTSVNHARKTMAYKRGSAGKGLIRSSLKATRPGPTYCLAMSWGMDELIDALAAGASDVADITYLLSRREAKNAGHGVGKETYLNRNSRILVWSVHEASPGSETHWGRPVER